MIWKIFTGCVLVYFAIAFYGSHSVCRDSGGVLVTGIGWFVCVEEVKAINTGRN